MSADVTQLRNALASLPQQLSTTLGVMLDGRDERLLNALQPVVEQALVRHALQSYVMLRFKHSPYGHAVAACTPRIGQRVCAHACEGCSVERAFLV